MSPLEYVQAGIGAVFMGPAAFEIFGIGIPITIIMVVSGALAGILVGATPGLGGGFLMAVSLPILISAFGFTPDALLPVLGFLVGVMKGSTIGGAVPAILFNTPGTADAIMTTLDGYPMAQKGQSGKALKTAHFASVTGDTFSDLVLFTSAPFLAVFVEKYLGFSEKAALIILSLSFVAAMVGSSPFKGLIAAAFGLVIASVGSGEDFYPRMSLNSELLSDGFPLITVILGVLIIGEVFVTFEDMWHQHRANTVVETTPASNDNGLSWAERRKLMPFISISAVIGTVVGALPGIGSSLAAALGYSAGQKIYKGNVPFGQGAPEGVAATEAANSAVSGANLIPVLSLGIPGNVGAVFLILAAESIGGFNPGPSVFRFSTETVNPELIIVFGLFTTMMCANLVNWTIGLRFMHLVGFMVYVPKHILMPIVLLITMTALYVQETDIKVIYFLLGFGVLGYLMKRGGLPILPFIIAFVLADNLESSLRKAFAASGADPYFLFRSATSIGILFTAVAVILLFSRKAKAVSK